MSEDTLNLGLGSDGEDHPRRLLLLPNPSKASSPHLLAYGGDDGTISVLERDSDGKLHAKPARRFDDPVRAVACSRDGQRVAVGFEDGSTKIYCYPSDSAASKEHHSFISKNEEDELDGFLSQTDGLDCGSPVQDEESFPGARFDAPIRCLEFDPRSYHLAIASEAGFCVVDATSSQTLQEKGRLLQDLGEKEHDTSGIRGLAYSLPNDNKVYLSTLAMDGRLCTWDMTAPMNDPQLEWELEHRDSIKCIQKVDVGEINGSDPYDRSCLPVWSKTFLALPGQTDLHLRRLAKVSDSCFVPSLEDRGHVDTIVASAFSPDEKYVITSGRDGRLILWKLNKDDTSETVGEFVCKISQYKSIPTHLLWSGTDEFAKKEVLYLAFADGTLTTVSGRDKIVPTTRAPKKAQSNKGNETTRTKQSSLSDATKLDASRKRLSKSVGEADDADSDDDTVAFDLDGFPDKDKNQGRTTNFLEDEAQEDNDEADKNVADSQSVTENTNKETSVVAETEEQLEIPDDDFNFDTHQQDDDMPPPQFSRSRAIELPEPQPAFAPSSTPLDQPQRIMCWNHIGAVTIFRNQDGLVRNTVDIDFTDVASRRPVSFTDNMDFILGSLGEDGAIFATDLKEDDAYEDDDEDVGMLVDGLNMSEKTKAAVKRSHRKRMKTSGDDGSNSNGSSIYFHRFETFGSLRDKDWYLTLPDGERAMGCACGEGWAAVLTSRRFLRLFTSGGNQGQIIWLQGEPVTVVGRSRFVAVFYHETSPLPDGTQKLGFTLLDALSSRTITSGSVSSVSASSSLSWAGFSNDCSLMAMDSDGMLSMLVCMSSNDACATDPMSISEYSWQWEPMLDTVGLRKSADDSFWPVTIQDGKLVCVPLKGGNEHPEAARRPVTHTLGLRMPLARGTLEKSTTLEELSVRANAALTQKKFLNDIVASDEIEAEELQAEYDGLCGQVDKVTLKLFITTVEAGKLERSLDLVDRLHLEKSFEIAARAADQLNHRILSDRIEDARERRFPPPVHNEDGVTQGSFEALGDDFDHESIQDYEDSNSTKRISPDFDQQRRTKRPRDEVSGNGTPSPQPVKSRTSKFDPAEKQGVEIKGPRRFKQTNPFAKKCIESPAKPTRSDLASPNRTPSKVALSRSSTFSAQSREKSKVNRRIM